jgi:hypothetical protein
VLRLYAVQLVARDPEEHFSPLSAQVQHRSMLQHVIRHCLPLCSTQQQQLTFLPALLSLAPLFLVEDTRLGVSYSTSNFRAGGMACWAFVFGQRGKGELCSLRGACACSL